MKVSILYGLVVKFSDGGENMNSFMIKESAIKEAQKIISHIKKSNIKNVKLYLSELEYNEYKNRILSSDLINEESELLFQS